MEKLKPWLYFAVGSIATGIHLNNGPINYVYVSLAGNLMTFMDAVGNGTFFWLFQRTVEQLVHILSQS